MTSVLISYRQRKTVPVELLPEEHQAQAARILEQVKAVYPDVPFNPEADLETSWEELFRLAAGLEAFSNDDVFFAQVTPDGVSEPQSVAGSLPVPAAFDVRYGPEVGTVLHRHQMNPERFEYWNYETFRKYSGREHIVCGYGIEGADVDIADVGPGLAAQSAEPGRLFVKGTHSKTIAGAARLINASGYQLLTFDEDCIDASLWRFEGRAGALLAQPYVKMTHEYRFFIVHGRPVAGSANAPKLTPFEHQQRFDNRFREVRGEELQVDADRLERYREFATKVAAELAVEDPDLTNYVLDVATGPEGLIVVELNQPGAAGLYAVNPVHVAAALASGAPPFLRPWSASQRRGATTVIKTKRACSGCDELLGDPTEHELNQVMCGMPLSDTTAEHGCEPR